MTLPLNLNSVNQQWLVSQHVLTLAPCQTKKGGLVNGQILPFDSKLLASNKKRSLKTAEQVKAQSGRRQNELRP